MNGWRSIKEQIAALKGEGYYNPCNEVERYM